MPIFYRTAFTQKVGHILTLSSLWSSGTPEVLNKQHPQGCIAHFFTSIWCDPQTVRLVKYMHEALTGPVPFLSIPPQLALPAPSSRQQLLTALQSRNPSKYLQLNWSGCLEPNFISWNYFGLPNLFLSVSSDKLGLTSSTLCHHQCLLKLPLQSNGPGEKWFKRYRYFLCLFLYTHSMWSPKCHRSVFISIGQLYFSKIRQSQKKPLSH